MTLIDLGLLARSPIRPIRNLKILAAAWFLGSSAAFNGLSAAAGNSLDQLQEMAHVDTFSPSDQGRIHTSIQGAPVDIQPPSHETGLNISGEYQTTWKATDHELSRQQIEELRKYKFLLIPGFMAGGVFRRKPGNLTAQDIEAEWTMEAPKTFIDQAKWFESMGIEYDRLDVNPRHTAKHNAPIVAAAIASSDKPVIIISHSKGGLDFLEAIFADPSLSKKVKGWIAIQCPFFGSPVGDFIIKHPLIYKLCAKYLTAVGGSPDVLKEMTTWASKEYYNRKKDDIQSNVLDLMPVLTFGSWKNPEIFRKDTKLKFSRDLMWIRGIKNDGLVPAKSAILPGVDYISMGGIDHNMTTGRGAKSFDQVRFLRTLLSLLFRKI